MDTTLLIGIIGAALILIGFVLNNSGVWSRKALVYDLINAAGSGLLVTYSILIESIPFLILNIVWLGVALWDVIRSLAGKSENG